MKKLRGIADERDSIEEPRDTGGASSSGVKRKAEEPCEGEDARCQELEQDQVMIGAVEQVVHREGRNRDRRDSGVVITRWTKDHDLRDPKVRNEAYARLVEKEPDVLVYEGDDQAEIVRRFLCQAVKMQVKKGNAFVQLGLPKTDQNYWKRRLRDSAGFQLLESRSSTSKGWITTCPGIAACMSRCASWASIERGWEMQAEWDAQDKILLGLIDGQDAGGHALASTNAVPPEEDMQDYEVTAWDDVSGKLLDPARVREARALEAAYYEKMDVFDKVPMAECIAVTGKPPIKTKWIDHDKGTRYRSRWVAKEFKNTTDEDWFAATPPLEALRAVLSDAATGDSEKCIMLNDVSRAFFYAPIQEQHCIYVELCDEVLAGEHERGLCGRLKKSMYGTKAAAQNWQRQVQSTMKELGFIQGKSSGVLFYHPQRNIKTLVHGDDFFSSGTLTDLAWMRKELEGKFDITSAIIGKEPELAKEVKILNRIVRWHDGVGISYRADPKHAEAIVQETGAAGMSSVKTPMVRENARESDRAKFEATMRKKKVTTLQETEDTDDRGKLSPSQTSLYRGIAARANYLAADRPDLLFPAKELCRRMAEPSHDDWDKLVRLGRYLKAKPEVVLWYKFQGKPEGLETFSDTDWAGCRRTRRSTTGGYTVYGSHVLKMWCKTQATVALSSAEAELYGLVRASAETLGLLSLFMDFGETLTGHVLGDASAALAIVQRQGIGKMRHLDTNFLWVQEKALRNELKFSKIAGKKNAGDLFTKVLAWEDIKAHTDRMGVTFDHAECGRKMKAEIESLSKQMQVSGELRCWTRIDLAAKTAKTTLRGGPDWKQVLGRVTLDCATCDVLLREDVRGLERRDAHRQLPPYQRDTLTGLLYRAA